MIDTTNYLDLYNILRNELIGDTLLFIVLGFFAIWVFGTRYNIPNSALIVITIAYIGILFDQTRILTLWVFTLLFVGFLFYSAVGKLFR